MMDRDQIIEENPIVEFLESRGCTIRAGKTNRCATTEHKPLHYCVSIDLSKNLWCCHDCGNGGTVIDWVMIEAGISYADAMARFSGEKQPIPAQRVNGTNGHKANGNGQKPVAVKQYDYTDENGNLLFCVCRFEPKDFRQKAPDGKGGWIYKLDGVRRVLYNLPNVLRADVVFLCEGEKDADTLNSFGVIATTNCGGAKKWDDSYTAVLKGKNVVILPDNDPAGQEHLELLRTALGRAARSLRIVQMPEGVKDISDFVKGFPNREDAEWEISQLIDKAEVLYRGESVPIQTMEELEREYEEYAKRATDVQYHLGDWIPSLRFGVRPLVPGEMMVVLASTGTGKTAILQNIAVNTSLSTLFIEKELPGTLSFERFAAIATDNTGESVEEMYRSGQKANWRTSGKLNHIICCHERMSIMQIEKLIDNTALKTSIRPVLVLIDYIQLVNGDGQRYERTSDAAEEMKALAKKTKTIVITASQVGRKEKGKGDQEPSKEIRLNDGKDSGAIENSAGLVIGAWRDKNDYDKMWLRILKQTKGKPGRTIPCRVRNSLRIVEEAQTEEPSQPQPQRRYQD